MITKNCFQVSTSSSVWPSENYWGTLAETYNVTFNGETITYEGARDQGGHLHEKLKAHISSNYMKVRYHDQKFFFKKYDIRYQRIHF